MINTVALLMLLVQDGTCQMTPETQLNGQTVRVVVCPIARPAPLQEDEELAPVEPRPGARPGKEFEALPPF